MCPAGGKSCGAFSVAGLGTTSQVSRVGSFQKGVCIGIFSELPFGPEGRGERRGGGRHASHSPRVVTEPSTRDPSTVNMLKRVTDTRRFGREDEKEPLNPQS